jgi:plasmid stabilization system protein ParE
VRIRIVPAAQEQIRETVRWWRENRPAARNAISQELRRAFRLLRAQPAIGPRARNVGFESVRRILLARVHRHLYYRVNHDQDEIEVLAFWNASSGSGPLF